MNALLHQALAHLKALVGFDTRNPPRAIGTGGIFDYLRAQLQGFDIDVSDHEAGAVGLFAIRGQPKLLFNVHLDTVPDSPRWSADPFDLRMDGDRAIGLGACDTKGAAAALLAAFLESRPAFAKVIVAEPTRCKAILAHRGIQSVRARFEGRAGHASAAQRPTDSALHQAVRWSAAALDFAESRSQESFRGLRGMRFNLGRIEGGIKANVIAPEAELRFGMRPLPSVNMDDLLEDLHTLVEPAPAAFEETFRGPPLPANAADAEQCLHEARALAQSLGIPVGDAVDFWTEAALFSKAGCTTFVYGPGDIAQAHSADEWVSLDELEAAARTYLRITEKSS